VSFCKGVCYTAEVIASETVVEVMDPRVRRTRQMLFDALRALLQEKDFEKISVQDIAEKATLNRATFYDHYPDKFALLEAMIGARFETLVEENGVRFDNCAGAVKGMALIVCRFLTQIPCSARNTRSLLGMHVQMAVVATIKAMILEGSRHHGIAENRVTELTATAAAWAICGAAEAWSQTPDRSSAEAVCEVIEHLVTPLLEASRTVAPASLHAA